MALNLLPIPISENQIGDWSGEQYRKVLKENQLYFVENIRTARRFISSLKAGISIDDLHFEVLNKETTASEIAEFGKLLEAKGSAVVLSESGCPGVADPGAQMVNEAHQLGIEV
ncbi:MAG TPA: SAM-dependent methyltransferase, partial [Catalimonadaceae bacterium]|nr:SAM-dependent methyltransferase [Catalimonadaceae bacterium]